MMVTVRQQQVEHQRKTDFDDHPYPPQVLRLLKIGPSPEWNAAEWRDYRADFGLTADDVPELRRLALDRDFEDFDVGATEAERWGPLHAMRAIAQLGDIEAVGVLLDHAMQDHKFANDQDFNEELLNILVRMGPSSLPTIAARLADPASLSETAIFAVSAVGKIVEGNPEYRAAGLAILTRILERADAVDPTVNAFAVAALLDFKAVEAIDTIRQAFAQHAVEPAIAGDIEDVEIDLGLRQRRSTPKPNYLRPAAEMLQNLGRSTTSNVGPQPVLAPPRPAAVGAPRVKKVGRNEPCPCGSGKKYKKCCLAADMR